MFHRRNERSKILACISCGVVLGIICMHRDLHAVQQSSLLLTKAGKSQKLAVSSSLFFYFGSLTSFDVVCVFSRPYTMMISRQLNIPQTLQVFLHRLKSQHRSLQFLRNRLLHSRRYLAVSICSSHLLMLLRFCQRGWFVDLGVGGHHTQFSSMALELRL